MGSGLLIQLRPSTVYGDSQGKRSGDLTNLVNCEYSIFKTHGLKLRCTGLDRRIPELLSRESQKIVRKSLADKRRSCFMRGCFKSTRHFHIVPWCG